MEYDLNGREWTHDDNNEVMCRHDSTFHANMEAILRQVAGRQRFTSTVEKLLFKEAFRLGYVASNMTNFFGEIK